MCGIAGIVGRSRIDAEHRAALGVMLDLLAHRGPDNAGDYVTENVALGHRRLSVIDLRTGRQPISNESKTVWTIANGEIYNFVGLRDGLIARGHRFRSAGDCECLVHLYEAHGHRLVDHLDGMFAFAIWDDARQTLLLARDRLGVKPLYYWVEPSAAPISTYPVAPVSNRCDGRLVFASELKAVLAAPGVGREIDPTAVLDYLTYGFIPSPKTIFKGIRKLPAGHLLVFKDGTATVQRYWDLHADRGGAGMNASRWGAAKGPLHNALYAAPRGLKPAARRGVETAAGPASGLGLSFDDSSEAVWSELRRATRSRLIADVPIGAFLSGGLDSTAVVAAMSQLSRNKIVTVHCGFEERAFDERDQAGRTASLVGSEHHVGMIEPDATGIVDTLAWHFDEPFADPSAIPFYYLSRHAREFVTVALSGDGGDEVLAGYRRYRFDRYEESVRRCVPRGVRRHVFGRFASVFPQASWLPRPLRTRATWQNLAVDSATAHALSVATLHPDEARSLLNPDLAAELADYDPIDHVRGHYHRCDAPDHLSKCRYVDINLGLADGILTKVDRASMAHGLEVRSPMLDHRFVSAAWQIPPRYLIRRRQGKMPLRRAVGRHVNIEAAGRAKSGFDVPLDDWFRGPLRERFMDGLLRPGAPLHEWVSVSAIQRLWTLAGRSVPNAGEVGATLWKLAMLDAWSRRFGGAAIAPHRPEAGLACIR